MSCCTVPIVNFQMSQHAIKRPPGARKRNVSLLSDVLWLYQCLHHINLEVNMFHHKSKEEGFTTIQGKSWHNSGIMPTSSLWLGTKCVFSGTECPKDSTAPIELWRSPDPLIRFRETVPVFTTNFYFGGSGSFKVIDVGTRKARQQCLL